VEWDRLITLAKTAAQDAERDRIALFRENGESDFPLVTFADDLESGRKSVTIWTVTTNYPPEHP
jgi:hypothetical protein